MHVAAQSVEFRHDDRTAGLLRRFNGGGKLRPPIESVGALAAFVLLEAAGT
jgi:hypothetical protein